MSLLFYIPRGILVSISELRAQELRCGAAAVLYSYYTGSIRVTIGAELDCRCTAAGRLHLEPGLKLPAPAMPHDSMRTRRAHSAISRLEAHAPVSMLRGHEVRPHRIVFAGGREGVSTP